MPKFFDPVNFPVRAKNKITLYPNKVILDGGGSGTLDISINGIKNTTIATYAGASYTTTATNWVTANKAFYLTKGIVVSNTTTGSASATIVATPLYEWDTVNRFKVTAPTIDTLSATFAATLEPNMAVAKTWVVTLAANTTVKYPKNAVEGDRIRIVLKNPSTYTVDYDVLGFFFVGGTEPTVTTNGYTTMEGVINEEFYPKVDTLTLTGTAGTANVTAGGLTELATFAAGGSTDLAQTATDFVASWADAYAAVGYTVTASTVTLIFTPTTRAAGFKSTSIKNVSGSLAGTVATARAGRVHMNTVYLDIKQ
jgi:hypothetical protein